MEDLVHKENMAIPVKVSLEDASRSYKSLFSWPLIHGGFAYWLVPKILKGSLAQVSSMWQKWNLEESFLVLQEHPIYLGLGL